MPGKKARGVAAPGTPPKVRETYEALRRDPEAREYAEKKGRHGPKGTLAAIAWAAAKGKRGRKKKSLETPTVKEREREEAAEKSFAVGENVSWYPFREMIPGGAIDKAVVTERVHGETRYIKRTVNDEALMACLREKIRSKYRYLKKYEPSEANAKDIYENVLADSVYGQYIEAAINLMKKKAPFSVAYVRRIVREVNTLDATKTIPPTGGDQAEMPVGY